MIGWLIFQGAITIGVFALVHDPARHPIGAAAIAGFVAFLATGLLSRFLDWWRYGRGRSVARSQFHGREAEGELLPPSGLDREPRNPPQQPERGRIGQDRG